ncbi:hypothetical protein ACPF04_07720 [Campylobacter sp. MOP51]|uniref:hypothetical protein n=1 Tax=Campylobacter canis TaxID=3378588 RepID=UPI003C463526
MLYVYSVTVDNAKVKVIRTYGGDDSVTLQNAAAINGSIATGDGDDKIFITGENTATKAYVSSQTGDDTVIVPDGAKVGTDLHAYIEVQLQKLQSS